MKIIAVFVASLAFASAFIPKQNVASSSTKLQERLADRVRTAFLGDRTSQFFVDLSHTVFFGARHRSLVWICFPPTQM
jgi:hypothetical protein